MNLILSLILSFAFASTTKVGNGDDGADLEGHTPITDGPIFAARAEAIQLLKSVNVPGVEGLGQVLPELEHSTMYLAAKDTRALSNEKGWETAGPIVYARTFAEPHAPTRFFPSALKLTRPQLVALHTHEALHRALPPGVREDEDRVAMLTMAITSPSATFDRVNRVAADVLHRPMSEPIRAANSRSASEPLFHYAHQLHHSNSYGTLHSDQLGFTVSLTGARGTEDMPWEGLLTIDQYLLLGNTGGYKVGPLSFTGRTPIQIAPGEKVGAMARFSLRSLENNPGLRDIDRDVLTMGAFLEKRLLRQILDLELTYTFAGRIAGDRRVAPIWSARANWGARAGRFIYGLATELHHVGDHDSGEPFTILRTGPKVAWSNGRTEIALGLAFRINETYEGLDSLADFAGHGWGRDSAILEVKTEF